MKLGEVVEHNGKRWIVTSRYPQGYHDHMGFAVLTPIPPGMEPAGLGRDYEAAYVTSVRDLEPNENMFVWKQRPEESE